MKKANNINIVTFACLTALMLLLGIFISGCSANTAQVQQNIKNVRVTVVSVASLSTRAEYPGKTKYADEITVSSRIPGKVSTVNADVGDTVKMGQVLFTLETKETEAQLRQAQAGLNLARANLEHTAGSAVAQQILQLQSTLKQAELQYNDIKKLYDRTKSLYGSGTATRQQLDDAESKLKNASIQYESARDSLDLLKQKTGPQSVKIATAQVEQAQAAVDLASIQLENARVLSPVTGIVSARNTDAGELISNTVPAFMIIDTGEMTVEVNLPDRMTGKIEKGQVVPIRIDALDNREFEGMIERISPVSDARTQYYPVRIRIADPGSAVKPGMFARVSFTVEKRENVPAVPNEAIVIENGVEYVYVVAGNAVKRTAVNTGISTDRMTEVTSGLKAGDSVITEGQGFLSDGEKVNVVK